MTEILIGTACTLGSLILIQSGMQIAVALMFLSFIGVWAMKTLTLAGRFIGHP